MTKYVLKVEYKGTDYSGWQSQDHGNTVQDHLEKAIKQLFIEKATRLQVAGRTDAGVHSLGQVTHFETIKKLDPYNVRRGLNHFLHEQAISVIDVAISNDNQFHARFSAEYRDYEYRILQRETHSPFYLDSAWYVPQKLNIQAMQQAAKHLLGTHDFSSFRAAGCQSNSPIKTIDAFDIWQEDEMIYFYVKARSFLYHQVRNMVGTLTQIGKGHMEVDDIVTILEKKDRTIAGPNAPAHGLYFKSVGYSPNPFKIQ